MPSSTLHNSVMTEHAELAPVAHRESSFRDDYGISIHTFSWLPPKAHAVVQIAHGVGEHAQRYDEFARYLAARGYAVYANDHRGHGETGRQQTRGELTRLGKLGPGGLKATEQAITNFTEMIRSSHPNLPFIFLGHSWGSMMGQRIIDKGGPVYDGVILSGSAYRTPRSMESGDLNQHHKHLGITGFEWLSRDPKVAAAFVEDELCFKADILKQFGLFDALRLFGTPQAGVADVPMLIMSGTDDPLSVGDSVERLAAAYRNHGVTDVTLTLYQDGRHEMLQELNRATVFADIADWLDQRFGAKK